MQRHGRGSNNIIQLLIPDISLIESTCHKSCPISVLPTCDCVRLRSPVALKELPLHSEKTCSTKRTMPDCHEYLEQTAICPAQACTDGIS
eukprot:6176096-Pleurochrysis_carterae.AAC.3